MSVKNNNFIILSQLLFVVFTLTFCHKSLYFKGFLFLLITESYGCNVCFSCHHNGKHPCNSHYSLHKNGFHGYNPEPLSAFLNNLCLHECVSPTSTMNVNRCSFIIVDFDIYYPVVTWIMASTFGKRSTYGD